MTDPTPQTTPTRDEAVRDPMTLVDWLRACAAWCPDYAHHLNDAADHLEEVEQELAQLASAPAPASGGVDAVERLEDKIEGLEADLASAVEVAFRRGAAEWTRLNYPALYVRLNAASLSPAATPVSEAEPVAISREMIEAGRKAIADERERVGQQYPDTLAIIAYEAMAPLAKPASSPAGGDVVEQVAAIIDPEIWAIEQPVPTRAHVEDFHQRRRSSCELAQRIIAALSQSTSSPEANPTASGETVGSFRDRSPVATQRWTETGPDQNSTAGRVGE